MAAYRDYITDDYIRDLSISAILHDIGKVGIQDAILLKPGKLTEQEFDIIKKHPMIGADVITEIEKNISGQSLYSMAKEIAQYHHERWDGSGYPAGLASTNIPLSARITAPNQIPTCLPIVTSPITVAFSALKSASPLTVASIRIIT